MIWVHFFINNLKKSKKKYSLKKLKQNKLRMCFFFSKLSNEYFLSILDKKKTLSFFFGFK